MNCPHCGMIHQTTCPRIKALDYYPDGTVKRVEFHPLLQSITSNPDFKILPDAPAYTRGRTVGIAEVGG
jgi:hypothetical protein